MTESEMLSRTVGETITSYTRTSFVTEDGIKILSQLKDDYYVVRCDCCAHQSFAITADRIELELGEIRNWNHDN